MDKHVNGEWRQALADRLRSLVAAADPEIVVDATPAQVWAVVSDVTRTGEWSPVCTGCWWDEETPGPTPGAWFTGRNETPARTWESRSQVVTSVPEVGFSWSVGFGFLVERYGDDADAQIEDRHAAAVAGIPETLAAIKRVIDP